MQMPPVLKCLIPLLFLVNATSNILSYHNSLNCAGIAGGDPWTAEARADSSRPYAPQATCWVEVCFMHL
jgi:hypothetical protein